MRHGSWVRVVHGNVLSVKRWSDTHIGSSGGGGYVGPRGGVVRAPTIISNVVQRSQVFVLVREGTEEALELGDLMPLREGQTITALYGGLNPDSGHLLLLHNHQSNRSYAEPLRPNSAGPILWSLLAMLLVWGVAAILVAPLSSVLPEVPRSSGPAKHLPSQPLDSIFTLRSNQRHAQCLLLTHHQVPNCAAYEKAPVGGGSLCACKSVSELLDGERAELNAETTSSPGEDRFAAAAVMVAMVGGLGGIFTAIYAFSRQMRSRRKDLLLLMVNAAEQALQIAGVAVIATIDGGNALLKVKDT